MPPSPLLALRDASITFGGRPTFAEITVALGKGDRACLVQLVNAIAPIMTETGGAAWRQAIFHPFAQMSNFGQGRVLRTEIASPTYAASYFDPRGTENLSYPLPAVPYLKLAAVHDEAAEALTLFALNRHLSEEARLAVATDGFAGLAVERALTLHDADLAAVNTNEEPDRVRPTPLLGTELAGAFLRATLPPASWTMIRLRTAAPDAAA